MYIAENKEKGQGFNEKSVNNYFVNIQNNAEITEKNEW
jgi:hypothetical protein